MKKKIIVTAVLLAGIFCTVYFWNKYSYAGPEKYFVSQTKPQDGLQIGIIGDSWVVRQNLDSLLEAKLQEKGVHAEVYASGNPGAKTKLIYENLFKEKKESFSSKEIIEKKPDYCIVIAGVNDAATHVGPDFYTHHMMMIINTLLHYGIKPVIIPLPEFGLEEDSEKKNILSSLSNKGSELVLNGGKKFEIKDYRNSLLNEIKKQKLDQKIILLNFDEVSSDFEKDRDLYADPLHLNLNGYQKFSDFLVKNIINLQRSR
ncbi:MAG: SGNH/GDSL hydrolase family protein [Chryseobacterium sp.]|jgi:lysophospholipase L1-like esterase|uniref:SGNH/GDSL hydrolase family protein n=1 Tax=Chryseobacterium sp. TaxID=1871047 RepID=UPI00282468A2|nr:SGNH/GDSL hydrolase family protein [Chryseobacterium sp.]MDR2235709.1 SGNH/GDSL hydrolase family protein [Chryseobacterium sp.]